MQAGVVGQVEESGGEAEGVHDVATLATFHDRCFVGLMALECHLVLPVRPLVTGGRRYVIPHPSRDPIIAWVRTRCEGVNEVDRIDLVPDAIPDGAEPKNGIGRAGRREFDSSVVRRPVVMSQTVVYDRDPPHCLADRRECAGRVGRSDLVNSIGGVVHGLDRPIECGIWSVQLRRGHGCKASSSTTPVLPSSRPHQRTGQPSRSARSCQALAKTVASAAHNAKTRARALRSSGTTSHVVSVLACHASYRGSLSALVSAIIIECTTRCRSARSLRASSASWATSEPRPNASSRGTRLRYSFSGRPGVP